MGEVSELRGRVSSLEEELRTKEEEMKELLKAVEATQSKVRLSNDSRPIRFSAVRRSHDPIQSDLVQLDCHMTSVLARHLPKGTLGYGPTPQMCPLV